MIVNKATNSHLIYRSFESNEDVKLVVFIEVLIVKVISANVCREIKDIKSMIFCYLPVHMHISKRCNAYVKHWNIWKKSMRCINIPSKFHKWMLSNIDNKIRENNIYTNKCFPILIIKSVKTTYISVYMCSGFCYSTPWIHLLRILK